MSYTFIIPDDDHDIEVQYKIRDAIKSLCQNGKVDLVSWETGYICGSVISNVTDEELTAILLTLNDVDVFSHITTMTRYVRYHKGTIRLSGYVHIYDDMTISYLDSIRDSI